PGATALSRASARASARATTDAVRSSNASRCAVNNPSARRAYRSSQRAWSTSPPVPCSASQDTSSSAGSRPRVATYALAFSRRSRSRRQVRHIGSIDPLGGEQVARRLDLQDGKSDSFANGGFVVHQIGEVHAIEDRIDLLLEQHPHGPDAARVRGGAPLVVDRVRDAVQIECSELRGRDHIADGDLVGRARERIAAVCTARALDDVGPAQPQQDLLDVIDRKPLAGGYVTTGDRTVVRPLCQVQRTDQ